jgi:uncharacterized protein
MSAPRPDRVDVGVLAADRVCLTRRYPVASLERIADALVSPAGEVEATFEFERLAEGLAGCQLEVSTAVRLRCQRCLEPFEQLLRSRTKLAFVGSDEEAGRVPDGFEAVSAGDGWIDLRELVEDELLLSLPIVALHGGDTRCAASSRPAAEDSGEEAAARKQRPFAQLQDLLKN